MNLKKRKTYRRLLGMIYFGGLGSALVAGRQWVAEAKTTKNQLCSAGLMLRAGD